MDESMQGLLWGLWHGGEQVLAEIVAAVPPEIVVRDTFSHDYIED